MKTRLTSFLLLVLGSVVVFSISGFALDKSQLMLMPWPKQVELGAGEMSLRNGFTVQYAGPQDERVTHAVDRLYNRISRKLGFVVMRQPVVAAATLAITCDKEGSKVQSVSDDESYTLTVTADGATLHANEPVGVLRGLETFYQLAFNTGDGYGAIPLVTINDGPRFPWRGLLLDVARHYMPLEHIEREVDGLAAAKMNVLHLHLSDDQSFRVQSKKFPALTEKGSHGQFYTQDQIKELIAYARDRGVRIVPEFDVPGHSTAWLAAFPDLAVHPADLNETFTHFGGYMNTLDPSNPKLMKVLDKLFGEMASLFPDEYFHIGGDEVVYKYWRQSPSIAAFKEKHHLQDERAVQAYFNTELGKILKKHHKKMMGWNEILHADLPTSTVIQSWEGVSALQQAVQRGYPVVVSLGYYLDNYMPAWFHYNIDPLHPDPQTWEDMMDAIPNGHQARGLIADKEAAANFKATPEDERFVMGGEAAEWTELTTPWSIDGEIWPRLAAIAERFWSPADVKDVDSMYHRLDAFRLELADLDIGPDQTLQMLRLRLGGSRAAAQVISTFAEAVEPTKVYTRHQRQKAAGMYELTTPVNRLVDAVAPESRTARAFHQAVNGWLANHDAKDLALLKRTLRRWQENDPRISKLAVTNPRMAEAKPIVDILRGYIAATSEAIGYIERGEQAPAWWTQAQQTVVKAPMANAADLQLAFMCDARRLVEVASGAKDVGDRAFCVSN